MKTSGFNNIINEIRKKPWNDFSFKSEDPKDKKVYKGFKWILCEISPVLKEILNDEENQAKNCKEIVVSNANHIEAILFFGHMKIVDTKVMNLLNFYAASKEYQVKALEIEVINMFNSVENQKNQDWYKLFWLSYVNYPEDQQMRAVFEKVIGHVNCNDKFAEANINFILELDEVLFDIFFDIMVSRGVKSRFNITEAYLIKHICDGNKNIKLEDIDPSERDLMEWYINKMNSGRLDWDTFKIGPLASNLVTTKHKFEILEIFQKAYNPKNNCDIWIFLEIQSSIQDLHEASCNTTLSKVLAFIQRPINPHLNLLSYFFPQIFLNEKVI